jgi:5-formaminoimidazole-4-carboxamide-1-(beta)-D-ribofuranosyl 5'-monophosphate synthetase
MNPSTLLDGYDASKLTVGVLGGHTALDITHGAKQWGFQTMVVAQQGRHLTFQKYFKVREEKGCIDEVIVLKHFQDVLQPKIQEKLREMNTIMVHGKYFSVYFDELGAVENSFNIPLFGSRHLLRLEERSEKFNQYDLLKKAGIRTPKIFEKAEDIDRPAIVKAREAQRGYERGFFLVQSKDEWEGKGLVLEHDKQISADWRTATIEEFIVGSPVNFNFFYSPLTGELELMGTDTRRQTNLDGFLRMTYEQQAQSLHDVPLKMIESGHIACTVKESILEKAFAMGESFVKATQSLTFEQDPSQKGIIGPFALQGSIVAEEGKEDIVIYDVSFRAPGSPGIAFTPYSGYLYGQSMSMGERIGMEIRSAIDNDALEQIVT